MDKKSLKNEKCGYSAIIDIKERLFALKDEKFKEFHSKLMPTVKPEKIIGVKIPKLRKLAKEFFREGNYMEFLNDLPHYYYEENNIHACLIEEIKDFDLCVESLNKFLPYVDNWATCDMMFPKALLKDEGKLLKVIEKWLESEHTYMVRFAIVMLMKVFIKEKFEKSQLKMILSLNNENYYVKMAIAWYLATLLTYNYDEVIKVFEDGKIKDKFILNKAISKANDSFRIEKSRKDHLKKFKIK